MTKPRSLKLFALKLAKLSRSDQFWLLDQLPEQKRVKIRQLLTVAKRFRHVDLNSTFEQLLLDQTIGSNVYNSTKVGSDFSPVLQGHMDKILSGEVIVTKIIQDAIKRKAVAAQ